MNNLLLVRILFIVSLWISHAHAHAGDHPCVEGQKLRNSDNGAIYLCLDRELRHIPNPDTFNNLFNSWTYTNVVTATISLYDQGNALVNGAELFKGSGPEVYLRDDRGQGIKKRWIISPPAFNKYDFNWGTIKKYPDWVVNLVPTGANING
eukprot:888167_1